MHEHVFEKYNFLEKYPEHYLSNEETVTEATTLPFNYICINGIGHPEASKAFNKAIQLIEGLIFTIKFRLKGNPPEGFFDFNMPPCEAYRKELKTKPEDRKWTVSVPVPDFITEERVIHIRRVAQAKSEEKLSQIKFKKGKAKKVIQILNIGGYDTSKKKEKILRAYAKKNKLTIKGDYQEIYLNDMRRTKIDRLETILRFEVK